ncbi:MAG: glutathione S-transferase N-terminal domain-containing protein [Phenylobacterium sp.]|nr:glutathione S-transferase N-terminal domain-containing protein [Phenylobacterium sp.]
MMTFYGGPTPNGRKVAILLEEFGLSYEYRGVDILAGDQLKPEFVALNPNNKQPVLVDPDAPGGELILWESGAILWHLAETRGGFLPTEPRARAICHQWLMFQMSGVGPMFGQHAHFSFYAKDKHPYAMARYASEVDRLLRVLEGRLAESRFLAGEDYTIADIATYPYTLRQVELRRAELPSLARWSDEIGARPAVQRGMDVGREELRKETIEGGLAGLSEEQRSILFGPRQYAAR